MTDTNKEVEPVAVGNAPAEHEPVREEAPVAQPIKAATKAELRAKVFAGGFMQPKRIPITLHDVPFELKQPTVEEIMSYHSLAEGRSRFAHILIHHVVLPGTNETFFDEADYDQIIGMPFTPEMMAIQEAMTSFLTGNTKDAEKN